VAFAGRPLENDPSPGDWIAAAVGPFDAHEVGSLVPPVFEAYARVFHPAARYAGDEDVDVRWAEVAGANAAVAHPAMEWGSITGLMEFFDEAHQSPLWDAAPARGHLPAHVAQCLSDVLSRHTSTPDDCFFGISADFGFLPEGAPVMLRSPAGRPHALVRGPIGLAAENMADEPWDQSAGIWWPADRAWFVVTDIDLVTTYVGGSAACIADLLAHQGLEAAAVTASQGVTWDADTINPLPLDGPD
jgi:hypothetical protein